MGDAIKVLEQAWAIAYREIGKEGDEVATIDMITGAMCSTPVSGIPQAVLVNTLVLHHHTAQVPGRTPGQQGMGSMQWNNILKALLCHFVCCVVQVTPPCSRQALRRTCSSSASTRTRQQQRKPQRRPASWARPKTCLARPQEAC
jgi:hypothetical protein